MGIHGNQQEIFQTTPIIMPISMQWTTHRNHATQQIDIWNAEYTTYRASSSQPQISHDFPHFFHTQPQRLPLSLPQGSSTSNRPLQTDPFSLSDRGVGADRTPPMNSHSSDPGHPLPTEPQFSPCPNMPKSPSVSAQTFSTEKTPAQLRPKHPAKPNSQTHVFLGKSLAREKTHLIYALAA